MTLARSRQWAMHVAVIVFLTIVIKADDITVLVGIGLMLFPSIVTETLTMIVIG